MNFDDNDFGDSILFAEKPIKKHPRKAVFTNELKMDEPISPGIDLFEQNKKDEIEEDKNEKQQNKNKTTEEIEKNFPFVKRYIFFVKSQDFSISKEQHLKKIDNSIEQTYQMINTIFIGIRGEQKAMDKREMRLNEKIQDVNKDLHEKIEKRAAMLLYYELKKVFYNLKEIFVQDMCDKLIKCLEYIQVAHKECPEIDIKVNTHFINDDIHSFPQSVKKAVLISKRKRELKKHIKKMKVKPPKGITKMIKVLCSNLKDYDEKIGYFSDVGGGLEDFTSLISNLPIDFQKIINFLIAKSVSTPQSIGKNIYKASKELLQIKKLNEEKYMKYIFIYFARYFSNQMYIKSIYNSVEPSKSITFANRIERLRKISPFGFGIAKRYLKKSLTKLALYTFPRGHMYQEPVDIISSMSFMTCPIDFCKAALDAQSKVQVIASNFSFKERQLETGQLFAKSDSLLSFDDLFDISFIVFLLAGACDLLAIADAFEPFVHGMMMPSEFEFAFTNFSEICHQIASLDIDKFIKDAMDRTNKDLELDPLLISNYIEH